MKNLAEDQNSFAPDSGRSGTDVAALLIDTWTRMVTAAADWGRPG
jgi:hypothetical protein